MLLLQVANDVVQHVRVRAGREEPDPVVREGHRVRAVDAARLGQTPVAAPPRHPCVGRSEDLRRVILDGTWRYGVVDRPV